jgi:UDP-N-acetyl-D-glucosamine dehydrogenase
MSTVYTELLDRITSRRARVGVVGLGYVGLPLAVEFARAGFHHDAIADWADLVVDARNAVKRRAPHIFRLGAPAPVLVPDGEAEAVVAQAG